MSGLFARTATAAELFERRIPPLYHLPAHPQRVAAKFVHPVAVASHALPATSPTADVTVIGDEGGHVASPRAAGHQGVVWSGDLRVTEEVHVTTDHTLWKLGHVFFEHPDLPGPEVVA